MQFLVQFSQNIDATYKTNLYKYTSILMIFQKVFGLSLFCQFHFLNPERTAADGTVQLGPFRYDNPFKIKLGFYKFQQSFILGNTAAYHQILMRKSFNYRFNPFKKGVVHPCGKLPDAVPFGYFSDKLRFTENSASRVKLHRIFMVSCKLFKTDTENVCHVFKISSAGCGTFLQKNVLFSGTIKENLRWGNKDATDEELIEACKLACAHEFISQFPKGYDTYIEQGGTNVSGGQRQRLCIARALLKKPKILILDDSTSAVDTKTDAKIRKALKNYMPETTKIIIAQRTASVEDADRIIVMDGGTINGIGTHEQLLAENTIYREIYFSQNKAGVESGK